MESYLSLYEYLGRAAGSELGKAVAKSAYQSGVDMQTHQVSNPKYEGQVLKYPKTFLDEYFGKNNNKETQGTESLGSVHDDELPF
jgi:hypothetical protein